MSEGCDLKLWAAKLRGEKIERLLREGRLRASSVVPAAEGRPLIGRNLADFERIRGHRRCVVLPLTLYVCYISAMTNCLPTPTSLVGWDTARAAKGLVMILAVADREYHGYRPVWHEADIGPLV